MTLKKEPELFYACLTDVPARLPMVLMEFPIFVMTKKRSTVEFSWFNPKYDLQLTVTPTAHGIANMYDLDILIFIASQLIEASNNDLETSKRIKLHIGTLLKFVLRGNDGDRNDAIINSLRRLKGTLIETNIPANGISFTDGFSLIDGYKEYRSETTNNRLHVEITLSDWLYRSILSDEIRPLSHKYFKLTKMFDRNLYLLCHKHLGNQQKWNIRERKLHKKLGSRANIYKFRDQLKNSEKIIDIELGFSSRGVVTAKRRVLA